MLFPEYKKKKSRKVSYKFWE